MDIAEEQVRSGGYNSFSFRGISKQIGIKSASIHYHFPTKADLGLAIAQRYTVRFIELLNAICQEESSPKVRLSRYIDLFRHVVVVDKNICLCGILATETDILPGLIHKETALFFEQNKQWLIKAIFHNDAQANQKSNVLLACLEGALLLSKVTSTHQDFEDIALYLTENGLLDATH